MSESEGSSGAMVADELLGVLLQFHREVVLPDMLRLEQRLEQRLGDRIDKLDARVDSLRDETLTHFDEMYKRFDQLESEYHALTAAMRRLEQ